LCENLVNFGLVIPEMTGLICMPMYLYRAKIAYTPSFVVLAFIYAWKYWKANGRVNSGNNHATLDINVVGF